MADIQDVGAGILNSPGNLMEFTAYLLVFTLNFKTLLYRLCRFQDFEVSPNIYWAEY